MSNSDDGRHEPPYPAPHPLAGGAQGELAIAQSAEPNRLLRALPAEEYGRLLLELTPVRLESMQVLVEQNAPIRDVYLIRDGIAAVLACEADGSIVEVGTIGNEGFVGLPVLHGLDSTPHRTTVQVPGTAWRLSASVFREIIEERVQVRRLLLRYAQCYTEQVSQVAACNRLHTLEERCARWLLATADRVQAEHALLTHEFIAHMLGVRRAGVTVAMGVLQREGIIRYRRGRLAILDRERLEAASCGCYEVTRGALRRLFVAAPIEEAMA